MFNLADKYVCRHRVRNVLAYPNQRKLMKKIRFLSVLLNSAVIFLLLATGVSAQQQTKPQMSNADWVGEYKYTYTEGKTEGGDVPVIEYLLVVSVKGDSLAAHFTVDGYQAYDDYSYMAKAAGNQLNLYFLKNLGDPDMGGTGGKRLKKGQLVGTLVKTTVRGKSKYQYKNGAYEISFRPQNPVYFKKS
jgi:hypothetical protein